VISNCCFFYFCCCVFSIKWLLTCCWLLLSTGDLIGLVAETLEGLPIITAFAQNKYFIATAANKIDEHHRALFNGESLNLWLAFYCDLYGAILVLAVCVFAVVMRQSLGAAAVGLAFSNTIQVGTLSLPACLHALDDYQMTLASHNQACSSPYAVSSFRVPCTDRKLMSSSVTCACADHNLLPPLLHCCCPADACLLHLDCP
jgi:hypothetical protein